MKCILALVALLVLAAPAIAQPLIVIDPGHGGNDPGGTGTGMEEKDIVLDTSKRFRDLLNADTADTSGGGAWRVELTRETDVYVGLSARAAFANAKDADRFMSVHANAWHTADANGTETYSYTGSGKSAQLSSLVQEEMVNAWHLTNRGPKVGNYAVLRETNMFAELHELGFITNATDAAKLASPADLQKAAEAHLRAIQRHMGFEAYIPGAIVEPEVGSIAVTVYGADGPLVGARISMDGTAAGSTNEDGSLQIDAVEAGEHLIGAVADGHKPADRLMTIEANQAAAADFDLELILDECPVGDESCELPKEDDDDGVKGGCSTSGDGGLPMGSLLVLLTLTLVLRRRANGIG